MSNRGLPKHRVHKRAVKRGRKLSLRRLSAYVGLSLGAIVLAVAVLIFVFGGAILDGYGKRKAERAFAEAHPGSVLRIGELDYSAGASRLAALSKRVPAIAHRKRESEIVDVALHEVAVGARPGWSPGNDSYHPR